MFLGYGLAVCEVKIVLHPRHEVVFEPALYNLVEEVRSDELVDVRTGEVVRERLGISDKSKLLNFTEKFRTYDTISNNTVVIPDVIA